MAQATPLTLDLIDPSDSIMDAPITSPSAPFSPHGIIGQHPHHKVASSSTSSWAPAQSYTSQTQPKTPSLDFDVSTLIAHATKQHEDKKEKVVYPQSTASAGYQTIPTHATYGSGAFGTGGVGVIGDGLASRRAEEWGEGYTRKDETRRVHDSLLPAPGSPAQVRPFLPDPAARATPGRDIATDVQTHFSALGGLLHELLGEREEVERLRKEVEMWKGEWGRVERERKRLESAVQEHEQAGVATPKSGRFTAVLLDGDGLIFHDKLLQTGYQGGLLAARTLLSSLPRLSAHAELSPSLAKGEITVTPNGITLESGEQITSEKEVGKVVVQVFLNKSGLGNTLVKAGVIGSWGVFDSFWQGFSSAHDLFTVIDVGNGKEASDAKIREYLKLYVKNTHCEMILLGASHDNGYATVLSSLQTESRLSKLLLLKGYEDLAYQLRAYSSRVVVIPDLFRQTRLITPTPATMSFSSIVRAPTAAPIHPVSSIRTKVEIAESEHSTSTEESVEVIEWEMPGQKHNDVHGAKDVKGGKDSKEVKVNRKGRREREKAKKLEEKAMAEVSTSMSSMAPGVGANDDWIEAGGRKVGKKYKGKGGIAVISVRNLKPRPCHTYYLSPWGCKAADDCDYSHDYKLSENQMEELGRLAKEMICPYVRNNKCHFSAEECVYGHKCPRGDHCSFGETCRFNILDNAHDEEYIHEL